MTAILVVQAASSSALAGLVWFVQLVHYPLFAAVDGDRFAGYAREHGRRTTWVAAPLMVVEAAAAALLVALEPGAATVVGAALVAVLWLSTFLVQVPCHRVLGDGWDAAAHARLVRTNWLRTALWSARAGLALALLTVA